MLRSLRRAALALGLVAVGGCNWWYYAVPSADAVWYKIPWFDHMIDSRAVAPYQSAGVPRYTPAGTVPVNGGEPSYAVGDPAQLQYGFDTLVANTLTNPTQAAATLGRGDTLFVTYCAMCHGYEGAANGTVTSYIGAPSLLTPRARGYTDGYLYSLIRYGRGVMPRYGDKIFNPMDRWAVVNYVRKLQAQAPDGGAPAGGAN